MSSAFFLPPLSSSLINFFSMVNPVPSSQSLEGLTKRDLLIIVSYLSDLDFHKLAKEFSSNRFSPFRLHVSDFCPVLEPYSGAHSSGPITCCLILPFPIINSPAF